MNPVHRLRDLLAFLSNYGQCVRCRRSWRSAKWVMVRYDADPNVGMFCLCVGCWLKVASGSTPGLSLQAWAFAALEEHTRHGSYRTPQVRRSILAAYGMAHRFELEESDGSYEVRVRDTRRRNRLDRADLSPAGERVINLGEGATPEAVERFREAWLPSDPPGWNGAGSDTELGDMETNRG